MRKLLPFIACLGLGCVAGIAACSAGGADPSFWGSGGDPPPATNGGGGAGGTGASGTQASTAATGPTGPGSAASSSGAGQASSSAAASGSSSGGGGITWTSLYTNLFSPTGKSPCSVFGSCHTNITKGFKCGTDKDTCYNGYVSAGWIKPGANASSSPLVTPGQSCLCGSLGGNMPKTFGTCISQADLQDIKTWLATGAPNN